MSEVQGRQVEEVQNEQHLGPHEVTAAEQQDPADVKQVVDDEVAANSARGVDMVGIAGEEVTNVRNLKEEETEPIRFRNQQCVLPTESVI